jgi:hypothetical protein
VQIKHFVAENYGELEKCYGHCAQPATLKFLNEEENPVITAYSCHGAYLSRIIIYADSLEVDGARGAIARLLGRDDEVKLEDVRIATRYPWDLGSNAVNPEKLMMVAYWTQNYRRSKNDDPNRLGFFLCPECSHVFSQSVAERQVLCADCKSKRSGS